MEITTHHDIPTGRMWRLYALGWLVYLSILFFAVQLDDLRQGHFNWRNSGDVLWSTPQGFVLALVWPLSGWIERRRMPMPMLFLLHVLGAAAYGIGSYWLLSMMFS